MFNLCRCAARSIVNQTAPFSSLRFLPIAGYKSQYSIDKLYPNSNPDFASNPVFKHTQADESEFTGFIPVETLSIKYSRGSGPGGQHVNKVNTKVEVRFHVDSASWIPESVRPKLHELEASRITKDGWLVVTSDKTRKQLLNQADCLDKIRVLVRNASKKPYEPTEADMQVLASRREKARKAMLREKREHSMKKFSRSKPTMHDV